MAFMADILERRLALSSKLRVQTVNISTITRPLFQTFFLVCFIYFGWHGSDEKQEGAQMSATRTSRLNFRSKCSL